MRGSGTALTDRRAPSGPGMALNPVYGMLQPCYSYSGVFCYVKSQPSKPLSSASRLVFWFQRRWLLIIGSLTFRWTNHARHGRPGIHSQASLGRCVLIFKTPTGVNDPGPLAKPNFWVAVLHLHYTLVCILR